MSFAKHTYLAILVKVADSSKMNHARAELVGRRTATPQRRNTQVVLLHDPLEIKKPTIRWDYPDQFGVVVNRDLMSLALKIAHRHGQLIVSSKIRLGHHSHRTLEVGKQRPGIAN
jgi:hypothetical protein